MSVPDFVEIDPAERFNLVPDNTLTVSPGECGFCGYSGTDRLYLDPKYDVEFYGALFICEMCMSDMASKFGWANPDSVAMLHSEIQELEDNLTKCELEIERQGRVINGLQGVPITLEDVRNQRASVEPVEFAPSPEPQVDELPYPDVSSEGPADDSGSESLNEFISGVITGASTESYDVTQSL